MLFRRKVSKKREALKTRTQKDLILLKATYAYLKKKHLVLNVTLRRSLDLGISYHNND